MNELKPFNEEEPVIPPIFVRREKELEELNKSIFSYHESIVITGFDAIGKSSLLSTLLHQMTLNDNTNNFFPIWVNAVQFKLSIGNEFLSIITHQICAKIWTDLFKNPYSELLEGTLIQSRKSKSISKYERTLKRIFKIVTSENLTGLGKLDTEVSGKLFLGGKISESSEISNSRKSLQSFEFLLLLDELMEILDAHGLNKILVLCDQLNHLSAKRNFELFSNYIDVFSSKRIQFVVIAINDSDGIDSLVNSFSSRMTIGPLNDYNFIETLVNNSFELNKIEDIEFQSDVYPLIYNITDGHPWWTVKLCNTLFLDARQNSQQVVDEKMVNKYSIPFLKTISVYNDLMSRGVYYSRRELSRRLNELIEKQ